MNRQSGTNYMDSIFFFCHWSVLNIQSIREPHILRLSRERDLKDLQYAKPRKNLGVIGTIHFSLHHNQFFILQVDKIFSLFFTMVYNLNNLIQQLLYFYCELIKWVPYVFSVQYIAQE